MRSHKYGNGHQYHGHPRKKLYLLHQIITFLESKQGWGRERQKQRERQRERAVKKREGKGRRRRKGALGDRRGEQKGKKREL